VKFPPQQSEYFVPNGGQNIVSPALLLPNGVAFDAQNWECNLDAGYSRIGGYDKFVSGDTPAEMAFRAATISVATGSLTSGETLTGDTSGATLVFAVSYTGDNPHLLSAGMTNVAIYVTDVAGQFVVGETLSRDPNLSPATVYMDAIPSDLGDEDSTAEEIEDLRAEAEAALRVYMDKPGSGIFTTSDLNSGLTTGPILGVFVLNDFPYVVRAKNPALTLAADTNAVFVRPATPLGDAGANRYWEVAEDAEDIPTAGASFEFVLSNFADPAADPIIYGVSGTSKAFMYTGSAFTFITTGMADDTPSHVAVHQNRLWLSFKGSLQYCALGDPTDWTTLTVGAGELSIGSDITGLLSVTGASGASALLVSTADRLDIIYGASETDFRRIELSANTGALPKTLQWIGQPVFQNIFGLTQLSTSDRFGGFEESAISAQLKPFLDARRGRATASLICRDKNQYRIFFDDRTAVYVTFREGQPAGMFTEKFKHSVTAAWSCTLSNNTELMLIGTDDGGLYKLDVGTSFAGSPVPHFIRFAFNQLKSPRIEKHFRRTLIEAESVGYARCLVGYDLDYGGSRRGVTLEETIESPSFDSGGFWDENEWDEGYWDGATSTPFVIDSPGTGGNISIRLQGEDAISRPITVTGVLIDYTVRRPKRGL